MVKCFHCKEMVMFYFTVPSLLTIISSSLCTNMEFCIVTDTDFLLVLKTTIYTILMYCI